MYVNINGKLTKVTREEYARMVEENGKSPLTKMDELINAVLSVEEAISGGGGGVDDNTTYTISINDNTITLTGSDGTVQNIELPEIPGSMLSQSWDAENKEYGITLTNGDDDSTVQIQYHLIKNIEANQIVLMAGDKPVDIIQLAQDQDTKYTIEKVGNEIRLIPSDGSAAIPIELDPDLNTTYELSFNAEEDTLTLTPNDNSLPQTISLAKYADAEAVEEALNECVDKDDYTEDMAKKADKTDIPDVSGLAEKQYVDNELAKKANIEDIPDVSGLATKTELSDAVEPLAKKTDIPDVSSFITDDALQPYATTEAMNTAIEPLAVKNDVNTELAKKADKANLINNSGAIYNKITTNGDEALIFNESDGGGFMFTNNGQNLKSFVGVNNEGPTGVAAQIYSKFIKNSGDQVANKGCRLNINPNGFYYTNGKTNGSFEANDELATKKDLPDISNFVTSEAMNTALESKADASKLLKNGYLYNSVSDANGKSLIFGESDGGGSQFTNTRDNVISFAGVNMDTPDGVNVQLYAKFINNNGDQIKNKGSRLAVNTEGIYYTKDKTNGSFEANDEIVTLKDIDEVTGSFTEDLKNQNAALKAQIDMLNKFIREIKYPEIENMDVDMDISASGKDIAISGDVANVVRNITNANSVIAEDLNVENGRVAISATEDVEITNMNTSGTLAKATSNAAMSINNSGNVVIKDSDVAQNSYNAIEIGLAADTAPKNVLIDNIHFSGNLGNNAISIFGHAENAEIVISNCIFDKCSNPIRISNKTNVPAKIRFINCICNEWDSNADYSGFLLLQDYTSASAAEAEEANRFANLEITFENCYGPTAKIEGDAETLSDPTNQIIYIWRDKGGKVAYDAAKFPKINAF